MTIHTRPDYPRLRLRIGGEWVEAEGSPVLNPVDNSVLGQVPHASTEHLDAAAAAALDGFRTWRRMSPAARAEIILEAVRLIRSRAERIAAVATLEQGKPIAEARAEVRRASEIIEWDANEGRRAYGRIIPAEPGMRLSVTREPVGVVAAFAPWNFPINAPARKLGGALSAGCSIILKASEETPGAAMLLVEAFVDAGIPPGVVNLVFGDPPQISRHLIAHPDVSMLTFTGSISVGKHLAQLAAAQMKPVVMELGGHGPVIVCEDADPVAAARLSVIGKARNAGQVCVSPTRFFVHETIYDRFVAAFAERAAQLRIGNGLEAQTEMGPLANARRVDAIEALVADGLDRGASLVAGGSRIGNNGNFYPLTVLKDVPADARAMREEPFGPLALMVPVRDMEQALERANELPFGLAGYGFTSSARNVEALSAGLQCGNIAINHFTASLAETPFGGVKESGYGREGGVEGLFAYTTVKSVSHLVR